MKKIAFNIQKNSVNLSSLIGSKKSLGTSLLTLLFLIILSPLSVSAQECSFSLTATNNIESVNKEGRIYFIQIQNNGKEEMKIELSASNTKPMSNPDKSDSTKNVKLDAKILNEDGKEITEKVTLKPNELLKIQVKVTVPAGTPYGVWNNLLLKASSDKCNNYSTSLVLFTFIPNPDEK